MSCMGKQPKTMRGILLTGHGEFNKLEMRDNIPVPRPGPSDVLIRVAAAGVNNTDINTRTGWYSKQKGASEDASWSGAHSLPAHPGCRCLWPNCGGRRRGRHGPHW